jgi:hypothetical protein
LSKTFVSKLRTRVSKSQSGIRWHGETKLQKRSKPACRRLAVLIHLTANAVQVTYLLPQLLLQLLPLTVPIAPAALPQLFFSPLTVPMAALSLQVFAQSDFSPTVPMLAFSPHLPPQVPQHAPSFFWVVVQQALRARTAIAAALRSANFFMGVPFKGIVNVSGCDMQCPRENSTSDKGCTDCGLGRKMWILEE